MLCKVHTSKLKFMDYICFYDYMPFLCHILCYFMPSFTGPMLFQIKYHIYSNIPVAGLAFQPKKKRQDYWTGRYIGEVGLFFQCLEV